MSSHHTVGDMLEKILHQDFDGFGKHLIESAYLPKDVGGSKQLSATARPFVAPPQ